MFPYISYLLVILSLSTLSAEEFRRPWDDFLEKMTSVDIPFGEHKNRVYQSKTLKPTALIFLPGMGEPSMKYHELARDLNSIDATLYFWDHIGQGFSTHLLPENTEKTHIDDFQTHVDSFKNFLRILRAKHNQIYVISHSMGGHVTLRVLQSSPELIDKLVTTSPMIDLRRYSIPINWIQWLLSLHQPTDYALGTLLFKIKKSPLLSHSQTRIKNYRELLQTHPTLQRKWITAQWAKAATDSILKLNSDQHNKIITPILILQADNEYLVNNSAQITFCQSQPHCQLKKIDNAYHEILYEDDSIRNQALQEIKNFLK